MWAETKIFAPGSSLVKDIESVLSVLKYPMPKFLSIFNAVQLASYLRSDKKMECGHLEMNILVAPGEVVHKSIEPHDLAHKPLNFFLKLTGSHDLAAQAVKAFAQTEQ